MLKIVALNQDNESDENNEDEVQVTKEAEETIAVSEYMRALSLKNNGNKESALILLKELLETRVINEISLDDKNDKLFCVRYNCYKNIALIYEENGEKELALEHFLEAMELDDTEVYTMHRLGQLALKLEKWELAHYAFQKCLTTNPNHWSSADGILQVYCATENILAAYGWAMKWYKKDENYKRAIDVLSEITAKFEKIIPFFESVWNCSFQLKPGYSWKDKASVFPQHDPPEDVIVRTVKPTNMDDFRINELTWLTIGQFIVSVYEHVKETKQCIIFTLTFDDILIEKIKKVPNETDFENQTTFNDDGGNSPDIKHSEAVEVKNDDNQQEDDVIFATPTVDNTFGSQTPQQSDSNAEDSDNPKGDVEAAKPKQRRRCSDLSFLEQWGWHKNRRYSSRKKSQQDRVETDTTMNGFLKRMFAKFFERNFDNQSPFLLDRKTESDISKLKEQQKEKYKEVQVKYEEFQKQTEADFQSLLTELKSQNFDIILMIFLWLKYISKYWDQSITEEIKDLYYKIYEYYLNHYDLGAWNQLNNDDFNAVYRMAVFFLELDHEKALVISKSQTNEIDERWKMIYHHLMFNSGCAFIISDELYERNIIRLLWLDYCSAKFENDLNRSVECLLFLEQNIAKQPEGFKLEFPNLRDNNYLDMESVKHTRVTLQRKISLNNVKTLYDNQQFEDLVEILKDSLINSTEIKNSDNTIMKIQTHFEVLLESFWNLDRFEDCLIWSERCLKHAVDNLLAAPTDTYRYKEWAESVNFILIYIEELILKQSYEIFSCLEEYQSRLVQSIAKILTHQLDAAFDKNNNSTHPVNTKKPWVILHQILQRIEDNSPVVIKTKSLEMNMEIEDIEELLPHTLLILFTAHEFLGRRQWCTRDNGHLLLYTLDVIAPKIRAPYMDAYRDLVAEYVEQITYCLYGYPPKKARSRHIEEHDATPVELTWKRAIQLFDIYRPESLPEFNSYKLDSISADMEQLLLKIVPLIPNEIDPSTLTTHIHEFISGAKDDIPQECNLLPHRVSCIYYLLADYYFKNRDFSKTIKYYILDLTIEPTRFDSWAGLALSKASKLETKLNSCTGFDLKEFLNQSEDAIKCFEQCIKLNRENTLLWIEYGSFAYTVHSFCSRNMKHDADTLSMEKFAFVEARKEQFLKISYDCFSTADKTKQQNNEDIMNDDPDSHDEKWLHHYMLGKIAEKRKEHPKIFLDHYLLAANLLYENNATYPIKINHNNPSTLSVEALEIFYRTTSAIIKYLEQHDEISRDIGRLFLQVLKDLSNSPFAYNQAKIDDSSINAFKRKLAAEKVESVFVKQIKIDNPDSGQGNVKLEEKPPMQPAPVEFVKEDTVINSVASEEKKAKSRSQTPNTVAGSKPVSPLRRGSQESTATTGTSTTGTGTSSSTSSSSGSDSSSSDSSSSDSESESSEDEGEKPDENSPLSESELEPIYKSCIRNLEECVTRFSEHYKSIYRLVNHYLNAPEKLKDLQKCRQLLLGTYTTNLGNQILGLFADRKNNNFFNGIWRIPSSEIDRPGSFSSHLVKCVVILLEVLRKSSDHKTLIELALQLQRTPDNDKRYIKDSERKELYQQAMTFCIQSMRDILKNNIEKRDDNELLNLIIDVYKAHKKCVKHMMQREAQFTQILIEAYKFYVQDKVAKLPENANMVDLAIKLCVQEISIRKSKEKQAQQAQQATQAQSRASSPSLSTESHSSASVKPATATTTSTLNVTKPVIPGTRPRGRPVGSKNSTSKHTSANLGSAGLDPASMTALMSLYGNPALAAGLSKDQFQSLIVEYYKLLGASSISGGLSPPVLPNLISPSLNPILNPFKQIPSPLKPPAPQTSVSPSSSIQSAKIPQFDIKNLIASAASQVAKSTTVSQSQSATISIGSGQLTITPTTSKSSIPSVKESKPIQTTSALPQSGSKGGASISVTKVPSGSPSISVKPLSELSAPKPPTPQSQIPLLPELPKSLTITPAPSYSGDKTKSQQAQVPQLSLHAENPKQNTTKYSGKIKSEKKAPNPSPYARTQSPSIPMPSAAQLGNLASLASQFPLMGNFNLQNYNKQVNLLNSYADLLKTMGMGTNPALLSQLSQLTQFPMPSQKRPYTKRTRTVKNLPRFPSPSPPQPSVSAIPIPTPSISKAKTQPFVPPFNMPISKSPALTLSPNPSPGLPPIPPVALPVPPIPRPSVTPPQVVHCSPTKTLQQKLAEKQKANAMNENSARTAGSSGTQGKRKDLDVIILD